MINKCVFPIAGFGTRFLPVTKVVPKEMLPVFSKPLIEYAVQEALESGIKEMVMITNKYKESIKNYFEPHDYLNDLIKGTDKEKLLSSQKKISDSCNFYFENQDQMLGLGHAILQAKKIFDDESFASILPDDLCHSEGESVLEQMVKVHNQYPDKCIVAVEEVNYSEVSKYGIIKAKSIVNSQLYEVADMIEKPDEADAPSNLAIIGRYIFTAEIFEMIEKTNPDHNGEIQITNALRSLAIENKVLALKFKGKRIDCGSPEGYVEANLFFKDLN